MHVRKFLACWTLSILLLTPPVWAGPQGELPQGPGRDLVEENCTACHDTYVFYDPFAVMGLSGN